MKISRASGGLLGTIFLCSLLPSTWATTLQLRDGRTIQGKYLGGTEAAVEFLVNGKVERYRVADILILDFGDDSAATPATSRENREGAEAASSPSGTITVPVGTHLTVRMIDNVDSDKNKVGDGFQASLEEALAVGNKVLAPKGANVYGRLAEVKEAGRIEGRSELKLELTGIEINQKVVPIVTGDYNVSGKSRGRNTAEKVGGGAALGALIGAIAGGGKGAAVGAGVGAGAGTAVQVLTRGERVRVPSEAVLDFTLQQPVNVPDF